MFVTGTGTSVGKTIVSAAMLAAMAAAGVRVRAHKPVVTGLDGPQGDWPPDDQLLALAAGMSPENVAPLRFGPPVSPHLAASMAEQRIEPSVLVENARTAFQRTDNQKGTLIIEGVGGLLVPLTEDFTVRDLAVALGLPVLIAAAPGLGTINHTLLTIDAARAVGLDVLAVVLTPWPTEPTELERSNRDTIARLGEVEVAGLGYVRSATIADLAQAGDALPWRRWCPSESFIPSRP